MQTISFRSRLIRALALVVLALGVFSIQAKAGGDSYEISLNNKVLIKQALHAPFNLQNLDLTDAKATDKLTIRFLQCNAPGKIGKSRSISIRDEQGNIVKEWKFKDSNGTGNEMQIPVKDLVDLQKKAQGRLLVFYSADGGYSKGQKLAALDPAKKKTT